MSVEERRELLADGRGKAGEMLKYLLNWDRVSRQALKESQKRGAFTPSTTKKIASISAKITPFLKEIGIDITALEAGTDVAGHITPILEKVTADYISHTYSLALLELCVAEPLDDVVKECLVAGRARLQETYERAIRDVEDDGRIKKSIEWEILLQRERIFNKSLRGEKAEVEENYERLAKIAKAGKDLMFSPIASYIHHVQTLAENGFSFEEVIGCYNGGKKYFGEEAHKNQKYGSSIREHMQQLRTANTKGRLKEDELQAIYKYVSSLISFNKAKKDALQESNSPEFRSASPRMSVKYSELNQINAELDKKTGQVEMLGHQIDFTDRYLERRNGVEYGFNTIEKGITMVVNAKKLDAIHIS